jgi:hypothetical protein
MLSRATLAAASVVAGSARRALPKVAAIATQALGLATPSIAPPASEGADPSRGPVPTLAVAIR